MTTRKLPMEYAIAAKLAAESGNQRREKDQTRRWVKSLRKTSPDKALDIVTIEKEGIQYSPNRSIGFFTQAVERVFAEISPGF